MRIIILIGLMIFSIVPERALSSTVNRPPIRSYLQESDHLRSEEYLKQIKKLFLEHICADASPYINCFINSKSRCEKDVPLYISGCSQKLNIPKMVQLSTDGVTLSGKIGSCIGDSIVKNYTLKKYESCKERNSWSLKY